MQTKTSRSEYVKKYRAEHPKFREYEKEYQKNYYLNTTKLKRKEAKTKSISLPK